MEVVSNEHPTLKMDKLNKKLYLVLSILGFIVSFLMLVIPYCAYAETVGESETLVKLYPVQLASVLQNPVYLRNGLAYILMGVFFAWLAMLLVSLLLFVLILRAFLSGNEKAEAKGTKRLLVAVTVWTGVFFLSGMLVGAISQVAGGRARSLFTVAPLIVMILLDAGYAFLRGFSEKKRRLRGEDDPAYAVEIQRLRGVSRFARLELMIFTAVISVISVISLLVNMLTVTVYDGDRVYTMLRITGWSIIRRYGDLNGGGQTISFLLFAMLLIIGSLLLLSLISFLSHSEWYYKLSLGTVCAGLLCSLLVGLFGKYYQIVQKLNEASLGALVQSYLGPLSLSMPTYKVTSISWFFFLGLVGVVAILVARRPFTKGIAAEKVLERYEGESLYKKIEGEVAITDIPTAMGGQGSTSPFVGNEWDQIDRQSAYGSSAEPFAAKDEAAEPTPEPAVEAATSVVTVSEDRDPCPACTELDGKLPEFEKALEERRRALFEDPTLPKLVQFIVNYARDSRLHLSYTQEDIAAFIAGLGMSKLTILQGMSGTGKTSLPKIFTEALFSRCDIVEVESSWRDKSELLGYYNEFSKMYTPKKFTQALYRARLNPETLTFIVLDEMNLSRIEYYFSDFLSLMEHEADQRELKLLNVGLYRTENGETVSYRGLRDGHTVRIPENIWFIGTANRDESTFEISDKVYDRAHTMNFNKRAPKVLYYNDPIPKRYLPVAQLTRMFEQAKKDMPFNIDAYPAIGEVEKLLAPYNISFGNRVATQIEAFVSIYCSCFTSSEAVVRDAVETILLSKVVSKLELKSIDNKEELAAEFEKLQFYRCSEFILKIHED